MGGVAADWQPEAFGLAAFRNAVQSPRQKGGSRPSTSPQANIGANSAENGQGLSKSPLYLASFS